MLKRAADPPLLPALILTLGLAALAVTGSVLTGWAQDAGYVADIEDLPLMAGLVELPDSAMIFDKPAGRIVETYAQGPVTRAEVEDFYRDSLPQLGWREVGELSFVREGERLTIDPIDGTSPLTLRFTLKPE